MASMSSACAARQKGVAPVRSTPSRSRLYVVNQSDFFSRGFGSTPASSSVRITSMYDHSCWCTSVGCGCRAFGAQCMLRAA